MQRATHSPPSNFPPHPPNNTTLAVQTMLIQWIFAITTFYTPSESLFNPIDSHGELLWGEGGGRHNIWKHTTWMGKWWKMSEFQESKQKKWDLIRLNMHIWCKVDFTSQLLCFLFCCSRHIKPAAVVVDGEVRIWAFISFGLLTSPHRLSSSLLAE